MEVWKIQKALYLLSPGDICLFNAYAFEVGQEADFARFTKAGLGYETEIKRSLADFRADFKKAGKHEEIASGKGNQNYFSFCFSSKELAEAAFPDIPTLYGIFYAEEKVAQVWDGERARWALRTSITCDRFPSKIHDRRMDWKWIAFRAGQSYKSKVCNALRWPDAVEPSSPPWRRMRFDPKDIPQEEPT